MLTIQKIGVSNELALVEGSKLVFSIEVESERVILVFLQVSILGFWFNTIWRRSRSLVLCLRTSIGISSLGLGFLIFFVVVVANRGR